MTTFQTAGRAYLVCPTLIAQDARHGDHWSKGPACRRLGHVQPNGEVSRASCIRQHEHEQPLADPEGHLVNDFSWPPGGRPLSPAEWPHCHVCGRALVPADLDDPLTRHDPASCPRKDCADA